MGYKDVTIPTNKPPEQYSYTERRAELLTFILEAGHPDLVSRTKFADRYDVNPSTITRDIQTLEEEAAEELGSDAEFIVDTLFRKTLRNAAQDMQDNELTLNEVARLLDTYKGWLLDTGKVERAPDKHELDADVTQREALLNTDDYAIITDESDIDTDDEGVFVPEDA